ncbi:arp2/3 complex-activating protein rickA-like [Chelmon rostratus]|uniref:arp2/3 complex-activating protein rickA-like n=1 Tax=Chelmon rostratus TaxID=109905 RepID=UPI001BEAA47D|nr:arp2/3 complex-activating protein rickA-like [Chelmon rostratus]
MQSELNNFGGLRLKLQEEEKEKANYVMARDREVVDLKNLVSEYETRLKRQISETETFKKEKALQNDNLVRARDEINLMKATSEQLNEKIREQSCEIEEKTSKLLHLQKKYHSLKKEHEKLSHEVEETKRELEDSTAAAGKNQMLLEGNMREMVALKEKLEKEIGNMSEMVALKEKLEKEIAHCSSKIMQQQQVINLNEAVKSRHEQMVREYIEEIRSLRIENKTIKIHLGITDKRQISLTSNIMLRREKMRDKTRASHSCCHMLYSQHCQNEFSEKSLQLLKEKDKEIADLKHILAQQPNDAKLKLQKSQWALRDFKSKFMASEGELCAYMEAHSRLKEENKMLAGELKKLKLSKYTCLPPISTKSQPLDQSSSQPSPQPSPQPPPPPSPPPLPPPNFEDETQEQGECRFISRYTCLPPISTKSQPLDQSSAQPSPQPFTVTPIASKGRRPSTKRKIVYLNDTDCPGGSVTPR